MPESCFYPSRMDSALSHALFGLPVGARVREFEIISVLGSGKSSLTYKAYDHQLSRLMVIKEYLPAGMARRSGDTFMVEALPDRADLFKHGLKRFLAEGQYMGKFQHRVFREALQLFMENGTAYIIMPYYEGNTLRKLVREGWRVSELGELLVIILPVLSGIFLLHQNNYCHCDITPNNVLIRDNDSPILLDFGGVQKKGVSADRPIIDLAPGFAAKEQYESVDILGPWTDIYAISALSYYIVTGSIPDVSVSRIVHDSLKPLSSFATSELPFNVLKVIDKGLAVEVDDRYDDIASFAIALKNAITETLMKSTNPIVDEKMSVEKALASFTPRHQRVLENAAELRHQLQAYAEV